MFDRVHKLRDFETGEERKAPDGNELLAMFHADEIVKAPDEGDRSFWVTASTQGKDRDGDVIRARGWDLKNFRKNPVGLWMHNYMAPPVFRVPKTRIEDDRLMALAHFPDSLGQLSKEVYDAFMARALNAFSVGFGVQEIKRDEKTREEYGLPPEPTWQNGILFWKTELWELSAVTVPSNPEALAALKALGGVDHLKEMLQRQDEFIIELSSDWEPDVSHETEDHTEGGEPGVGPDAAGSQAAPADVIVTLDIALPADSDTVDLTKVLADAKALVESKGFHAGASGVPVFKQQPQPAQEGGQDDDTPLTLSFGDDEETPPQPLELSEASMELIADGIIKTALADMAAAFEKEVTRQVKRAIDYHSGKIVED